jgi:hypothetical protein
MKNNKILITLLLIASSYSSHVQANHCSDIYNYSNKEESDIRTAMSCLLELQDSLTPVGTVIFSKLNPNIFKRHYGLTWVLADGDSISKRTKYYKLTSETRVPDLRGVFIRGINSGRNDGKGDTENRTAGSYQKSSTKLPNRSFSVSANGVHSHGDPTWNGKRGPYELATTHRGFGGADFGAQSAHTTKNGQHAHTISGGDKETRPRNVAMFAYIKIN